MLPRAPLSLFAGLCVLAVPAALIAQNSFPWPDGKRVAVSFSFDDARASQVDVGVPLFDKYGFKATFFVTPRNVPKRLEGWKKAAAGGHEIGNHSTSHACTANFAFSASNALEDYTLAKMAKDIDGATAETERLLGVKTVTFAYPCGMKFIGRGANVKSYVPLIAQRFVAGRGFRDEMANNPATCDLAQILGMESDGLTFEQMKALVTTAAAEGGWLVFAGHEIGTPAHQTTQAAALEQFLQYAKDPANGIWLDTVGTIGTYVRRHQTLGTKN